MTKNNTLRLTLSAVVIAMLTLMAFVPQIGMIVIIPAFGVSVNFLLIPVCIAAIILGKYYGFGAGAYLGVLSLILAYMRPSGPIDVLFQYPHLSILPRLPIGFAVYFAYKLFEKLFSKRKNKYVRESLPVHFAATAGVLTNTILVSVSLFITTAAMETDVAFTGALLGILAMNMAFEIVAVNLIVPPVVLALRKAGFDKILDKRKGKPAVTAEKESEQADAATQEESKNI